MRQRIVILLALVVATTITTAIPVGASHDDFVLVYFPHEDPEVEFSDDWGAARPGGRRHKGSDIFSPKGTAIVAVADGFVLQMKTNRRSGWAIYLRHADGYQTWYMHLDNDDPGTDNGRGGPERAFAADLEVGDFVHAGQVIGYVGDSGNAEGARPHTHFEIRRNGSAIPPYRHLAAAHDRYLRAFELEEAIK